MKITKDWLHTNARCVYARPYCAGYSRQMFEFDGGVNVSVDVDDKGDLIAVDVSSNMGKARLLEIPDFERFVMLLAGLIDPSHGAREEAQADGS